MRRYHFDLMVDGKSSLDDVGLDFADDLEAEKQATLGLADMISELLQQGAEKMSLTVRTEAGHRVCIVETVWTVTRHHK